MTGKRKRTSVSISKDTKREREKARLALAEKIRQLQSQEDTAPQLATLGDIYERFIAHKEVNVKQSSVYTYRTKFKATLSVFGLDTLANRVTSNFIMSRLDPLRIPNQTKNEYIYYIKKLLRFGNSIGLVDDISFFSKINNYNEADRNAPPKPITDYYLTKDEISTLLGSMQDNSLWKDLTQFLILTGMRLGEAAALTTQDLDIKSRIIHITKNYDFRNRITTTAKTYSSTRDIYIQDELLPLCADLRRSAVETRLVYGNDLIFRSRKSHHYISQPSYHQYLRYRDNLVGKHIHPHMLRHTHCSLLAPSMDLDAISRRLGHSDSRITKAIYLHITEEIQQKDFRQIAKIHLIN